MHSYYAAAKRGDPHLWWVALWISVLLHAGIGGALVFTDLPSLLFVHEKPKTQETAQPAEATVQIYPDMIRPKVVTPPQAAPKVTTTAEPPAPPAVLVPAKPELARTSEDQRGKRPDKPAFIGERDTEAASDRTPDASAPPLPSQAGRKPRDEGDIETTNSEYRDGKLPPLNQPAETPQTPEEQAAAEEATQAEAAAASPPSPAATEQAASLPPPRENTLDGPERVEVPVPREQKETIATSKEISQTPAQKETQPKKTGKPITKLKKPIDDPAFSGNQKKTAIRGSISRTGRSSLDVADTPLGRYQALIGRAVELEWQRNCVRHRDFITPGYLTIRFFVEPSGRVRSVQFVDGQTQEIQKGFTLNSIRDADIPPMPAAMKADYAKEPLELIFNFYF